MITYELAKRLKDAGFPQMVHSGRGLFLIKDITKPEEGDRPYAPTLSELIEACGHRFLSVMHVVGDGTYPIGDYWVATDREYIGIHSHRGKTPEEAVIHLYLALNENPIPTGLKKE